MVALLTTMVLKLVLTFVCVFLYKKNYPHCCSTLSLRIIIWTNLNLLYFMMLQNKIKLVWRIDFWEEDLKDFALYMYINVKISSPPNRGFTLSRDNDLTKLEHTLYKMLPHKLRLIWPIGFIRLFSVYSCVKIRNPITGDLDN